MHSTTNTTNATGLVESKKNIFINEYKIDSSDKENKLGSIYTNFTGKKSLRINNLFNGFLNDKFINKLNKTFNTLQQEFNAVKEIMKIKNTSLKNTRYVLYTGQSLTDYLIFNNENQFEINDLDFFIFDFQNGIGEKEEEQIFETPRSVSEYEDMASTNYGYNIKKSEKINIKVERSGMLIGTLEDRVLNLVSYSDMFAEYKFKDLGYKNRILNSSLSTINFFDLNMVQHGFLIDLENMTFDYIFTKEFFEFFKLNQLSLNKKRVSYRSFERLRSKYSNLKRSNFRRFLENDQWKAEGEKNYYINNNYALFNYAYNKLNEKFVELVKSKIGPDGKINFRVEWELLNIYKNLTSFQNFIKPVTAGGSIDNVFFKNDAYPKYLCSKENINLHKTIILNNLITSVNKNCELLRFDYVTAELPEKIINNFEYLIGLFGGYEPVLYNNIKYFELINVLVHLSFLSNKKIKKLINFCEKNKLEGLDILFWIEQDPKILNMNLDKIKKVYKYIKGHGLHLFEVPFKFSINPSMIFEIFYNFINVLEIKIKEASIEFNFEINTNDVIGAIESGDIEFWEKIFLIKDMDELNNFFNAEMNKYLITVKKEIIENQKPFHSFDKIEVKIDDVYGTELISNFDLKNEGRKMNHCVGGFGNLCEVGKSIVFKIHSKQDDKFRYTIEFKPIIKKDTKELNFHVMQIRGNSNRSVPMEHRKQVDEIIKKIIEKLETRKSHYINLNEKKDYKQPEYFN